MYLKNKEFLHQVGKKQCYYIRMHCQQNIKICLLSFKSHTGLSSAYSCYCFLYYKYCFLYYNCWQDV